MINCCMHRLNSHLPAEEAKLQETTQKFGLQKNENEMVLQVHCSMPSAACWSCGLAIFAGHLCTAIAVLHCAE